MPSLGADMEAGTLIEWSVAPGDKVSRGDIIAVVETDKGNIDVEVWEDGVVEQLLVEPGTEVPVETPLAVIGTGMPEKREPALSPKPVEVEEQPATTVEELVVRKAGRANGAPSEPGNRRIKASPLARKMAEKLGLDLARIEGHGPRGVIQKADILMATAGGTKAAEPAQKEPSVSAPSQDGYRRAIASAMSRSNRDIPHYYVKTRIDMSRALEWLSRHNAQVSAQERLLPIALLSRAVALALKKTPELNGFWEGESLRKSDSVHLGITISLRGGGVVNPSLRDAQGLTLTQTMTALSDLIERSRRGRLRASEMDTATITLTNLGDRGVEEVYGVIYPPQVALVGFGTIREQPWAENGMLGVRPVVTATLAGDHRATDGRTGAQLLEAVDKLLQQPEKL